MGNRYILHFLIALGLIFTATQAKAQNSGEVSGNVTDAQSGETLPGVNILVKGTSTGASTDAGGQFELTAGSLQDTLVVSFVGYKTQQVPIDGRTNINVALQTQSITGEEMVVVGYGSSKKRELTTAVSEVKGDKLAELNRPNTLLGLQGEIPGVSIRDHGGAPGQKNTTIRIRGVGSLNDTSPLVLVDGIEQNINTIAPQTIENITVLKDAASTAIYGSRGANGVILVTTKSGGEEGVKVSYNGSFGLQNIALKPEYASTEQYFHAYNLARKNSGLNPLFTEEDIQAYLEGREKYPGLYPSAYNNVDKLIAEPSPITDHSLSISGGTEKLTSYLNFGYMYNEGWLRTTNNETRYQGRLNTDFHITDNIKAYSKLYLSKQNTEMGNVDFFRLFFYPINLFQGRGPDGSYLGGLSGENSLDTNLNTDRSGVTDTYNNLYTAKIGFKADIFKNIEFNSSFNYKYNNRREQEILPRYNKYGFWNEDDILYRRIKNQLTRFNRDINRYTIDATLTGEENIGEKHNVSALLGFSQDEYQLESTTAQGKGLFTNELRDLSGSELENRFINSNVQEWGLRSFFARVSYNYADKYLIQINGRYDGSSRFPEGNKYSFFPSGSIGWRISEEKFWNPISDLINNLKLRASYGINGNQSIGNYEYIDELAVNNNYTFNDNVVNTVNYNTIASKNLSWEKTKQFNVGINAGLLENRLEITFDWYDKVTDGILLRLPVAGTVGLNAARSNAGEVSNRGIEVGASWGDQIGDFNYSITANMSYNKNTLTDYAGLAPDKKNLGGQFITKEGLPVFAVRGLIHEGFYQDQQEVDEGPEVTIASRPVIPGNPKFRDINEDGKIDENDMIFLGSALPPYNYGINFNTNYYNFSFQMKWQGAGGFIRTLTDPLKGAQNWPDHVMIASAGNDYWTPDNRDATFPTPQYTSVQNIWPSTRTSQKITYIRLRDISLGYSIPQTLIQHSKIDNLTVYVSAQNPILISPFAHKYYLEPEAGSESDFRSTYYYQSKSWKLGIKVKF